MRKKLLKWRYNIIKNHSVLHHLELIPILVQGGLQVIEATCHTNHHIIILKDLLTCPIMGMTLQLLMIIMLIMAIMVTMDFLLTMISICLGSKCCIETFEVLSIEYPFNQLIRFKLSIPLINNTEKICIH